MNRRPRATRRIKAELDPLQIPYLEGYPVIAIQSVARAFGKYERACEWVSQFCVVGEMEVRSLSRSQLSIIYSCGKHTYRARQEAWFDIEASEKRSGLTEWKVVCPRCQDAVNRLFYRAERWACTTCHQLVQKRSLYGDRERLIAKAEKLVVEVHARPLPGRSAEWLSRQEGKLSEILDTLDATGGRFMDASFRHHVITNWHRGASSRTGRDPNEAPPPHIDVAPARQ